ncbi:MAG TPA: EI24 domain-containing protein [Gallionellaceae bacterium]
MKDTFSALIEAFRSLLQPKMLGLLLWPMLASTIIGLGAAFFFWGSWVGALTRLLQSELLARWVGEGVSGTVSHYLVVLILIILLFLAVYLTTLLITAVFAMPVMVDHIARKNYPDLERNKGGNLTGSLSNTAVAIAAYSIAWVLILPSWLFAPLAIVLHIILTAFLNQRLFRYDALAEHASKAEIGKVIERSSTKLYLLGGIAGLLQFVPVINLLSPVYVGLAFIHLCLAELQRLRQS